MSETGHPELQLTLSRLQRSYNLLNDAASIARIGCFEWEIEADRNTWSREMYEILGLDREELGDDIKAEIIFEMIHPDDLDHVRENHIRSLAENRSIPSEFRVIRPDKSVATLYASGKLEMDASGKPVRLLGTLQDITERKQSEESQRRSDELYRQVSDDGCGISDEDRSRIFDPFYTTKFRGRGLGLASVLGIVRGHKGALHVYSEVGKGTTLRTLLPLATGQVAKADIEEQGTTAPERLSGTVLVVDDELTVRAVAERGLQSMGLEVISAEDGREGLEKFRAQPDLFAVVVLDLTMPHVDGVEAYREIRKLRPDIPVLLMSGFNEQEAISQFTGEGIVGFLQKPFGIEELKQMVKQLLGQLP